MKHYQDREQYTFFHSLKMFQYYNLDIFLNFRERKRKEKEKEEKILFIAW